MTTPYANRDTRKLGEHYERHHAKINIAFSEHDPRQFVNAIAAELAVRDAEIDRLMGLLGAIYDHAIANQRRGTVMAGGSSLAEKIADMAHTGSVRYRNEYLAEYA